LCLENDTQNASSHLEQEDIRRTTFFLAHVVVEARLKVKQKPMHYAWPQYNPRLSTKYQGAVAKNSNHNLRTTNFMRDAAVAKSIRFLEDTLRLHPVTARPDIPRAHG